MLNSFNINSNSPMDTNTFRESLLGRTKLGATLWE